MGALFALIPFRDKLWAAGVIALVAFGWYEYVHLQHVGAAKQLAAEQAASKKVLAAANQNIMDLADLYQKQITAIQEQQNVQLKAAADSSADLAARLRVALAAGGKCPVLQGAPAAAPSEATGAGSIADAVAGLAAAAAHDNAIIQAERAERDALTGK